MQHQSYSLPGFRAAVASITEKNCHALFAFGHIITKIAFAMPRPPNEFIFSPTSGVGADFVQYLRGSFSVYDSALTWLQSGPLAGCLESPIEANPDFNLNKDDVHLVALVQFCSAEGNEDSEVYLDALEDLRKLFAMIATPHQSISVKTIVLCWLARASPRYIALVSERKPQALVILAHYCVMLHMVNQYWFMSGLGSQILRQCWNLLDEQFHELLAWPLSVLQIDMQTSAR